MASGFRQPDQVKRAKIVREVYISMRYLGWKKCLEIVVRNELNDFFASLLVSE
jgi:hypothetical protein